MADMNFQNDDELNYVSSQPDIQSAAPEPLKDGEDVGTLKKLLVWLSNRESDFRSIDTLNERDNKFDVDTQLLVNKTHLSLIREVKTEVEKAVNKVEEYQNGR